MAITHIRNFCIIAHIDHGKSTLADRLLEITNTVPKRIMREQMLDTMDLERERGITIKLQPVRLDYGGYVLNLIDTPGHVDFTYEVSRSLAAVEGAILLVDASQGVEAQTLGNLYLAMEQGVTIIPVINKIDLANADVERTRREIMQLLGCEPKDILAVSAKTGEGVLAVIEAIKDRVPPPAGKETAGFRALIFDSQFDEYQGVVAYVRVVDGRIRAPAKICFSATKAVSEALEVGIFKPQRLGQNSLEAGEIGYIVTGLKDVRQCRVGDTIMSFGDRETAPLIGYREAKPMVFAGFFPAVGDQYELLHKALDRLKLSDAALVFDPEHSSALGFGWRVGCLGLLHLEITQERIRREFGLELTVTAPSVAYQLWVKGSHRSIIIKSPLDLPEQSRIERLEEPWVRLDIISPKDYVGGIMQLVASKRGEYLNTEYLDDRAILHYRLPLASLLVDFYDKLKSTSAGYASMDYQFDGYRPANVVRLDVLIADEPAEALSQIVYRDAAYERGRQVVGILKSTLPRQQFEVKIQAAVGGKILAAERLSALRKDVTAKLYGGDVTRKQKLLKKQKKGKKRLSEQGRGRVPIPPTAYLSILKQ
ncbi:elongation factor 4 [Candidatus Uhrbacteria bacterium RIFCSPLOWO2_02_FULL_48_12]|uniref:Elongation factor 4 n=1 Tax=Candidatus Uhrbacteria bacterium RIFCSPLOWO2_02_FULL_48_12 TaxID=1802407 RepID=A0A1F7VA28_9BACT|nr:MAG: elongation factor 4 [Candidatus Uhrbacteria bacterium RIFCSPLOWO2_02_FULL_48_12]